MKTKFYQLLLALFALGLFLPACSDDNEVEKATLELSETEILVAKDAASKSISVTTNQDNWSYYAAEEGQWITLNKEGNSLKVDVAANTTAKERQSIVLVTAGGIQKRLVVKQTGGDVAFSIDMEGDKLVIPAEAGKHVMNYTSNAGKVAIEVPAEITWIKVVSVSENNFTLAVEENTEKTKRTAKLIVNLGKNNAEVEVEQKAGAYYILPVIAKDLTYRNVAAQEVKRGSAQFMMPDKLLNKDNYGFITKSSLMPAITYSFPSPLTIYKKAQIECANKAELLKPEFDTFMEGEGFKKISKPGALPVFEKTEFNYTFLASVLESTTDQNIAFLVVTVEKMQTEAQPTFTELPMQDVFGYISFREKDKHATKKKADIEKDEKAKGSTQNESKNAGTLSFTPKDTEEDALRIYFYTAAAGKPGDKNYIAPDDPFIDEVDGARFFKKDYKKVYWVDETGAFGMTKEAKEFFTSKGYPFLMTLNNGGIVHFNPTKKQAYIFTLAKYGESYVAGIEVFYIDLGDPASLMYRKGVNEEVTSKRIEKVRTMLERLVNRRDK
ncbi:MAG: BACON domain-containing protein [Phocaeicola sp.]|nr:BACON domain-containing protein [Phocaeicola sp.]